MFTVHLHSRSPPPAMSSTGFLPKQVTSREGRDRRFGRDDALLLSLLLATVFSPLLASLRSPTISTMPQDQQDYEGQGHQQARPRSTVSRKSSMASRNSMLIKKNTCSSPPSPTLHGRY